MKNKEGKIIYVGKARKLKNRVSSYFTGAHNYKTTKLVENIWDFDYIVVGSEKEALLLEINLIKDYAPEYNIMFMDGTFYPYIQLTDEEHPRLKIVRNAKDKIGGEMYKRFMQGFNKGKKEEEIESQQNTQFLFKKLKF